MTNPPQDEIPAGEGPPTSTGIEPHIAGLLCYLLGFVSGILFLVLEKRNGFVRFHAMQSIVTFGALLVINVLMAGIPILGWLVNLLLLPVGLVLWIVLMVKAVQGERFKLPWIGDFAERQL